MSQKEFDAARSQGHELVQANKGGDATGGGIQNIMNKQLLMADAKTSEHFREIGRGLSDRLSGADIGGLSKAGQGLAGRLKSVAGDLSGGKGFGADTEGLITALADYTGKDKSKLMGLAGEEVGAGVSEVTAARGALKHSRRVKGGDRSVDAFIEKMGLSGDVASHVRDLAKGGGSTDIDAGEAKAIEKFLGTNATLSASMAKGGEKSTVNAGQSLESYLKTSEANMSKIGTLLDGLVTAQKGGTK